MKYELIDTDRFCTTNKGRLIFICYSLNKTSMDVENARKYTVNGMGKIFIRTFEKRSTICWRFNTWPQKRTHKLKKETRVLRDF